MAISSQYSPDAYAGNGATTSFAITFPFESDSDFIQVQVKNNTTGAITNKTNPTHYTVSGSNVVMGTAPATGETLIIKLTSDYLQGTELVENDPFPSATIENALDKLTLQDQLLADQATRALSVDASISSFDATVVGTPAAGQIPVVNDDEDGVEWRDAADLDVLTLGAGVADFLATPSSANLRTALTDETGTGSAVFATSPTIATATLTSPTLTAPALGTVASGDISAVTGTPKISGINDSNGNEELKFTTTASAVNELTIANAATGNNPIISATGGDTNIGISLQPKGTGVVNILGTSTGQGEVRLFEDTDNGTNYTGFKAPASLAGNVVYTLPSADGSSNQVLTTNASGTLSWATPSSGGSFTYISSASASSSASVTFTSISSSYKRIYVYVRHYVPATNNTNLLLTVSTDNGSTWDSTGYAWGGVHGVTSGSISWTGGSGQAYYMINSGNGIYNSSGNLEGEYTIDLQGSTRCWVASRCTYVEDTATELCMVQLTGYLDPAGTINAIKFASSSGNITSGTFYLYGLTES